MARKAAMCCHNRRQKLCVGGSKLKDVRSRIEKNTCQEVLHSQPLPKKKTKKGGKKDSRCVQMKDRDILKSWIV